VGEDFRQELLVKEMRQGQMANWNKLTERQYNAIKTLLKGGATQKEAAEYMQVSPNTAFWVGKAETYEEYLQIKAEKLLSNKKRVAAIKAQEKPQETKPQTNAPQVTEHKQTIVVQATWAMTQEMQKTNELMKSISNKLAFIVDELCGTKAKEG
jgi:hypothetical protein